MTGGSSKGEQRLSRQAASLLAKRLSDLLADPDIARTVRGASAAKLPADRQADVDVVLAYDAPSYREALLIQAAYGLCQPGLDLRKRQEGGRGVAAGFARLLKRGHIRATSDAFQNIGKNVVNLVRGNLAEFDRLLTWASRASADDLQVTFDYAMASLVLTARPVLPMPELVAPRLTFFGVTHLLETLLHSPSGGAHEQFATAACLEAIIEEFGLGGIAGLRVETKSVTASDASSGVAGDIQVRRGNRTEEAIEVSATDWRMKLDQAAAAIRSADLPRAHILALVREQRIEEAHELAEIGLDVSVIDVRAFLRLLVAVMRKPARASALIRLYELLDRNQPNPDLVNAYVELIKQHGLAVSGS